MPHPFDRYAEFTDLALLREFSSKPLRKSVRVNTLKYSVEEFKEYAKTQGWEVEQVPWCKEGFFVERENREHALGKNILHLLGYMYMQEASSMLPVELLEPQPGNRVLDMSSAPGSKTTQIAAKLAGRGVVFANDVQEKRLGTLKVALHRAGVTNVIVTKRPGQLFGEHMPEYFDCVLCDAPCTAQGTSRKDVDALSYSSEKGIAVAAKLQKELLESAVHAARIGGRIVYSTCTLTPEENEEVVAFILNKFSDQLKPIKTGLNQILNQSITDSEIVQKFQIPNSKFQIPSIRLWPQTYNTEGFFCAVFEKISSTRAKSKFECVHYQERILTPSRLNTIKKQLEERYGTSFITEEETLLQRDDELVLTTIEVERLHLPMQNYALGMPFGKVLKDSTVRITNDLATFRGQLATKNIFAIGDPEYLDYTKGSDINCESDLDGDVVVSWNNLVLGLGVAKNGRVKNRLSRWLVQHFQ